MKKDKNIEKDTTIFSEDIPQTVSYTHLRAHET